MKPSDFQKTVQCRFESCLKKVVRHVGNDEKIKKFHSVNFQKFSLKILL